MRTLIHVTIPVEAGNAAIKSGKLAEVVGQFIEKWKPEATYFAADSGLRSMIAVLDMQDPSQIVPLAEPFFMELNAAITATPCMNADDLKKGMGAMGR